MCLAHTALSCHSGSIRAIHAKTKQEEGESDPVCTLMQTHNRQILEQDRVESGWQKIEHLSVSFSVFLRGRHIAKQKRLYRQ